MKRATKTNRAKQAKPRGSNIHKETIKGIAEKKSMSFQPKPTILRD